MQNGRITILINQQPYHFETDTLAPDGFRQAVSAPDDYEVWRVVRDPDPEGQLPVDDVQITGSTTIRSGERYRAVPPGTFGLAQVPPQLADEIEALRRDGHIIEVVVAEGWICVLFRAYELPRHFNKPATDLLLKLPLSFPNGKPDMFWTEVDVSLATGACPRRAGEVETALGKRWRRFSWHPKSWNPATDNLHTFLEFVNRRLSVAE